MIAVDVGLHARGQWRWFNDGPSALLFRHDAAARLFSFDAPPATFPALPRCFLGLPHAI